MADYTNGTADETSTTQGALALLAGAQGAAGALDPLAQTSPPFVSLPAADTSSNTVTTTTPTAGTDLLDTVVTAFSDPFGIASTAQAAASGAKSAASIAQSTVALAIIALVFYALVKK